ncbi:MAG: hypothetical protein ACE5FT_04975 [Candidatus Nanoarchaeia archaeon]
MGGRGQIALWIIIGIVLIGLAFFGYQMAREAAPIPVDVVPIQNYIETCLVDSMADGARLLGVQGGHIAVPEIHAQTEHGPVSFSVIDRVPMLATVEDMQDELSKYVADAVVDCVGDFPEFVEQGFIIEQKEAEAESQITVDGIEVQLTYPLKISLNNITTDIQRFRAELNSPLWRAHATMSGILLKTIQDPNWVDLTYLADLYGDVEILPHNATVLTYVVTIPADPEPFIFISAASFIPNTAPEIRMEPVVNMQHGEEFNRQVQVVDPDDDKVTCEDDTALFDITDDCRISFIAEVEGTYQVIIGAVDEIGNRAEKEVNFVVE